MNPKAQVVDPTPRILSTRSDGSAATSNRTRDRGPSRFTQADVARAIRAAKKEKLEIAAIRIEPDGTILIVPGIPKSMADSEPNEWDE